MKKYIVSFFRFYHPGFLPALVQLLDQSDYRTVGYLKRFWTTQRFDVSFGRSQQDVSPRTRALVLFVTLGAVLQVLCGLALLGAALHDGPAGSLPIGLALIVSYPIVWAHLLALAQIGYQLLWVIVHPKHSGRLIVCRILESQVVRLRKQHSFTLIAVAGSVGKTSTKLAIAHVLESTQRVIYQTGNYNDRVTVPLILFGQKLPHLFNPLAWISMFIANERTISRPNFYDVAVVEIGTDHPGQIAQFAYLRPEIAVITAVTPEHMENFDSIDAVASEELTVCKFAKQVLINGDDTAKAYIKKYATSNHTSTYGLGSSNHYRATGVESDGLRGTTATLRLKHATLKVTSSVIGRQGTKVLLAAAAVAEMTGLTPSEITSGITEVRPFSGRMQVLEAVKDGLLIDDSYNATPESVLAALDVLAAAKASQRIAILGSMNELGSYAEPAHTAVGAYCDPKKLDLVITIGPDAEKWLAPAARIRGCEVVITQSPYDAGSIAKQRLRSGAVVLVKGSQNRVFSEEAVKVLLRHKSDSTKLVRQSAEWMTVKHKQFNN